MSSAKNDPGRVVKEVSAPIREPLARNKVFGSNGLPIPDNLKTQFIGEGRLAKEDALEIIRRATDLLRKESNVLHLQDPITVCGDIHGQFYDLVKLFEVGGDPLQSQYLFLGDYVDRGCFACEVCLYLLSLKICAPKTFFMLRGNHECRHLTAYFNFKKECIYKYDLDVYDAFMTCFDALPLGAILNGRFLCIHGGLSPDVLSVADIDSINRFREPPPSGPMCDLLWADPMEDEDDESEADADFLHNDLRGCSYVFSYRAASTFLKNNNLLSVIRAHEAQDEGYRLYRKCETTDFPSVICIFSAPNYCDVYNNKGAIIRFQNNLMNIRQFNASPHPYYLPNFMNAFNWSIPFVAEKCMDMMSTILNLCDKDEDSNGSSDEEESPTPLAARREAIKTKIRSVALMSRMVKTLREESEAVVELKGLAGGTIPKGLLSQGPAAVKSAVSDFRKAKNLDAVNEKRPPMLEEEQSENVSEKMQRTRLSNS
jgi:serine/threonine-protein phosphatase 2B catalytic subunit